MIHYSEFIPVLLSWPYARSINFFQNSALRLSTWSADTFSSSFAMLGNTHRKPYLVWCAGWMLLCIWCLQVAQDIDPEVSFLVWWRTKNGRVRGVVKWGKTISSWTVCKASSISAALFHGWHMSLMFSGWSDWDITPDSSDTSALERVWHRSGCNVQPLLHMFTKAKGGTLCIIAAMLQPL